MLHSVHYGIITDGRHFIMWTRNLVDMQYPFIIKVPYTWNKVHLHRQDLGHLVERAADFINGYGKCARCNFQVILIKMLLKCHQSSNLARDRSHAWCTSAGSAAPTQDPGPRRWSSISSVGNLSMSQLWILHFCILPPRLWLEQISTCRLHRGRQRSCLAGKFAVWHWSWVACRSWWPTPERRGRFCSICSTVVLAFPPDLNTRLGHSVLPLLKYANVM